MDSRRLISGVETPPTYQELNS